MSELDIEELVARYGKFVLVCPFCKGDRQVFMKDFGDGNFYPYSECPNCVINHSTGTGAGGFFLMPPSSESEEKN